ncbi:hypothetical protein FRB95_005313 [Tulasnella sp. JGI-2019a]|nr:hypothetical protein FRB95_005313 [Tulasnella sp. JGI-2019a]
MLSIRPVEVYGHAGGSTVPLKTPGRSRAATAHPRTMMKENATVRQTYITQTVKPGRVAYPFTPKPKSNNYFDSDHQAFDDTIIATAVKPSTSYVPNKVTVLLDKTNRTPFHARNQFPVTPLPSGKLQLGLSPHMNLEPPPTVMRPSSTRKSLRAPRSSTASSFETPDARGRRPHWDVSDGDVSVEIISATPAPEIVSIVEEDDDEPEYMPPSVPEPDYDCPFEIPDYRALGASLMELSKCPVLRSGWGLTEDPEAEEIVLETRQEAPDDDDDAPFPKRTVSKATGFAPVRPPVGRPKTTILSAHRPPVTTISRAPSRPNTRPVSRTATTVSDRPVSQAARPEAAPTRVGASSKTRTASASDPSKVSNKAPSQASRKVLPPSSQQRLQAGVCAGTMAPVSLLLGGDIHNAQPVEADGFLFIL